MFDARFVLTSLVEGDRGENVEEIARFFVMTCSWGLNFDLFGK
jgi:hypothetical protein